LPSPGNRLRVSAASRIGPFVEALDDIIGHRDIWPATGSEIIDAAAGSR
jgi:hypothetical protein